MSSSDRNEASKKGCEEAQARRLSPAKYTASTRASPENPNPPKKKKRWRLDRAVRRDCVCFPTRHPISFFAFAQLAGQDTLRELARKKL